MSIQDYLRLFERELKLRNNSSSTIDQYLSIFKTFLFRIKRDPKAITIDQVKDYLLTLGATRSKRQTIYTLRNFYSSVLKMPDYLNEIPIPKQEKYVPNILNVPEVFALIKSIANLKQRVCIQLIYACALRIGESVNIRVADIDGQRMLLHLRSGKGAKDRIVPIPEETLNLLREYYKHYKPTDYLFAGQTPGTNYDVRSIQQVFHRAKHAAGIRKKVTVHSLRHSRATHLVDNGVDMSLIQNFLGHHNIKTTVDFYLHTSIVTMQNIFSLADEKISAAIIPQEKMLRLNA